MGSTDGGPVRSKDSPSGLAPAALAWSLCGLSIVALLIPVVYRLTGHRVGGFGDQPGSVYPTVTVLLFILASASVGAVVASKRPSNPIGWLVLASGLCYSMGTLAIPIGQLAPRWGDWLQNWVWGLGIGIPATLILLLFPTGTLPSRRWRPVAWLCAALIALTTLSNMFVPGVIQDTHSVNPLGIGGPLGSALTALQKAFGLILVAGIASLASLVFRYRAADHAEREQLKWLIYAGVLVLAGVVAGSIVTSAIGTTEYSTNVQNAIVSGTFVFVPLAIGIAVMRYRLYDIDLVINKSLVFGALAAFITGVYVVVVVGLGSLIGSGDRSNLGLSIAATAIVAFAFQPARERLQRVANRLVYGRRATPYQVLSDFSERVGGAFDVDDVLPAMARIVAEGMGASSAAVWLRRGDALTPAAAWPPTDHAPSPVRVAADDSSIAIPGADLTVPVRHQGETLGALAVVRGPGEPITPAEATLLEDLSSQAGLVLRNVALTADLEERLRQVERQARELRESRQRLVAASDAERRRLERNIHDGAQQHLVALAVRLGLVRTLAARDPERAATMVRDLRAQVADGVATLRDLARGIFPEVLVDRGLPEALRAAAARSVLPVTVDADGVTRHGPEVEAAVYFSVLEALQNAAKYSNATSVTVRVRQSDGDLSFEVRDDGRGFDLDAVRSGTGLEGMGDRLAAVGGALDVRSAPGQGTTVSGRAPSMALEPA